MKNAKIAQLVERDLAKVEVAGSSPVFRSNYNDRMVVYLIIFFLKIKQYSSKENRMLGW